MHIGFIGAGRVGCTLGHYFKHQGLHITGYYSRSLHSSIYASNLTNSSPLSLDDLISKSNYIFITTPDDEIKNVWKKITSYDLKGKKIFHASGCLSSSVFTDAKKQKVDCYSLHPIFPFSNKNCAYKLNDIIFSIEGENIQKIQSFLSKTNIKYFVIKKEDKPKYHAATVFASNYVIALAKITKEILKSCGLNKKLATTALYPLMFNSVENIHNIGIENSLTGPIMRGDIETVNKHIKNLDNEYKKVYKELGIFALKIVTEQNKLSNEKINKLINLLEEDM